jgi:hypothetical protein
MLIYIIDLNIRAHLHRFTIGRGVFPHLQLIEIEVGVKSKYKKKARATISAL